MTRSSFFRFTADRWLTQQNDIDLVPDDPNKGQMRYTIIVMTNGDKDAGTDSGVFLTIYGDEKQTMPIHLLQTKQGNDAQFQPNSVNIFQFDFEDIGQVSNAEREEKRGEERRGFVDQEN